MTQTKCGFNNTLQNTGADLLIMYGPTLKVDIGYDAKYRAGDKNPPKAGFKGANALVDTGANENCIDNILATTLKLPIIDRQAVSGSNGAHTTNIYQAQIYVPSLGTTIIGRFVGVDLIAGNQNHGALIGRPFLKNYKMIYEGNTGSVEIISV